MMISCSPIAYHEHFCQIFYSRYNLYRIDEIQQIKITEFGLSEDIYVRPYFRQGSNGRESIKLPVKWMAPESLTDGVFSESSDVVSKPTKLGNVSQI